MTTVRKDLIIDITANDFAGKTIAQSGQAAVDTMNKTAAAQRQVMAQMAQAEAKQSQAKAAQARDAMAEFAKMQRKDIATGRLMDMGRNIEDVAKVTKVVGALSLAADAATISMDGLSLVSAIWTGDLKKTTEAAAALDAQMKALPFGFSKVYGLGARIGDAIFGDKADAARINAQTEAILKAYADLAESAKKYRDAAAEAAKRQVDLLREGEKLRNPDGAGVLDIRNQASDRAKAETDAVEKQLAAAEKEAADKRKALSSQESADARAKLMADAQAARRAVATLERNQKTGVTGVTDERIAEARARADRLEQEARQAAEGLANIDRDLEKEKARIKAESAKNLEQIGENARLKELALQKEAAEKAAAIEKEKARALRDLQDQTARQLGQARAAADVAALKDQGRFLDAELLQAQNNYREKIRALNAEMDGRRAANPELEGQITQAQLSREAALAQERDAVMARAREENAKKEADFAQKRDNLLIDSQSKLVEKQKELEGDSVAARLEANQRVYDQMREQAIAAFKDRNDPKSRAALNQLMNNYAASQKADAEKIALEERTAQAKGIRQGGFAATLLDNSFMDLAGRNNPMLTELKSTSESNRKQAQSLEKMVDLTQKLLDKFGASEGPQLSSGFGLGGNS